MICRASASDSNLALSAIAAHRRLCDLDHRQLPPQTHPYPMVTRMEGAEPRYQVDLVKAILPVEPPTMPVRLEEETLRPLRSQDYMVRGVMELDHILTGTPIGKRGERSACAAFALAVDGESGMVLAPDANDSSVAAGDALARVFLKAVQATFATSGGKTILTNQDTPR